MSMLIFFILYLTARRAASLRRFSRSAPVKPGVRLASSFMSMSLANCLFLACILSMASRPFASGTSSVICLSNLPGLKSAGSSTSGLFVAATTMTPEFVSKPSISTSSWLRVCSLSSWPPPRPAPLWRPTASISSMNMMQGADFFACANMSLTLLAPTPTNISTKSEPEM